MSNNLYQKNNNNNTRFGIIASFTRSFDSSHIETNRIHLISSICLINSNDIEMLLIKDNFNNKIFDLHENYYIFIVLPHSNENKLRKIEKGNLLIIVLTISELIGHLGFTEKSNQLFENIFGELNLEYKDFNVISQNSLFIFLDQLWSNILLNFKINKIDVSGGSISKRHILQTVNLQLVLNLLNVFDELKIINNIIYNSFKSPILSSSIPLKYYQKFFNNLGNINNLKVKDIVNNPLIIQNLLNFNDKELFNKNNFNFEEIIINNLKLSVEMLIKDIIISFNNQLDNFNKIYDSYNNKLIMLSHDKDYIENIDKVSTKYMKNKTKKIFKKERSEIKQSNISNIIANLNNNISVLERKIEDINNLINNKQNELNQFNENNHEYTLLELNNLHTKYIKNNSLEKTKLLTKKNILKSKNSSSIIKNGFRSYHSLNNNFHSLNNTFYSSINNIKKIILILILIFL